MDCNDEPTLGAAALHEVSPWRVAGPVFEAGSDTFRIEGTDGLLMPSTSEQSQTRSLERSLTFIFISVHLLLFTALVNVCERL